jgi:hypothetical protein
LYRIEIIRVNEAYCIAYAKCYKHIVESKLYKRVSTKGVCDNEEARALPPAVRCLWHTHVRGCLRRDIENSISITEYYNTSQRSCFFCGREPFNFTKFTGQPILYNGVDRLDNKLPYTPNNIVACCKVCNGMKSGYTAVEFFQHCDLVSKWFNREGANLGAGTLMPKIHIQRTAQKSRA